MKRRIIGTVLTIGLWPVMVVVALVAVSIGVARTLLDLWTGAKP